MRTAPVCAAILLALLCAVPCATAQHDLGHLVFKGDRSTKLELAPGWQAPAFTFDGGPKGPIEKAPFWCSHCEVLGRYSDDAEVPDRPETLLGRPLNDMLRTVKAKKKRRPIVCAGSRNVIVCDLPPTSSRGLSRIEKSWIKQQFGKVPGKLDTHRQAHLWMLRTLHFDAQWRDLMCLEPDSDHYVQISEEVLWGYPPMNAGELWLFQGETEYREFCRQFFPLMGVRATWWAELKDRRLATLTYGGRDHDKHLHARVCHLLAHQRLLEYRGHYIQMPLWLTEGLGHWFERRFKPRHYKDTFCKLGNPKPGETGYDFGWDVKNWKREIKSIVGQGKDYPLNKLALWNTKKNDLPVVGHAQAWSLVSYMLSMGKERFRTFVDALKGQPPGDLDLLGHANAFQVAYGANPVLFHKHWRTWVTKSR